MEKVYSSASLNFRNQMRNNGSFEVKMKDGVVEVTFFFFGGEGSRSNL